MQREREGNEISRKIVVVQLAFHFSLFIIRQRFKTIIFYGT